MVRQSNDCKSSTSDYLPQLALCFRAFVDKNNSNQVILILKYSISFDSVFSRLLLSRHISISSYVRQVRSQTSI